MTVKLSDEQAKALGLEAHIPKRVTRARNLNELGQNKLEARFDRKLADEKHAGLIGDYWFEEIKFRLAARTFYTPDFVVALPDWTTRVYEVKGGLFRDDARVKIKVAAEKYPHIRWVVARCIDREWVYETIKGRG